VLFFTRNKTDLKTWGALRKEEYDRKMEEDKIQRQKNEEQRAMQKCQEKGNRELSRQLILDVEALNNDDDHDNGVLLNAS